MNSIRFSIIIPVLHETKTINVSIGDFEKSNYDNNYEIIVVDGDPNGSTVNVLNDKHVVPVITEPGHAKQMNAGANIAKGEILLFLQPNTKLPFASLKKVNGLLQDQQIVAGAFDLKFSPSSFLSNMITFFEKMRYNTSKIFRYEQALFIRKTIFEELSGFNEKSPWGDFDLMIRLKNNDLRSAVLGDQIPIKIKNTQILKDWLILMLLCLGISPTKLVSLFDRLTKR